MIQLVGPGGAGKSTVGAVLATRLGRQFLDLDREFEGRHGDIDMFIATQGYESYARANIEVYLELVGVCRDAVLALSSGFMVYPESAHSAYAVTVRAIAADRMTFVLLPSLDPELCVAETVRRQLGRPFGRRDVAREEIVIRARFERYLTLPAVKIATMRPVDEIVALVQALLAAGASDSPCTPLQVGVPDHAV